MEPQCGERLNDGRWRCLACGWTGLAVELLPRRFEGNSFLSFLCPNCRKLEGVAVEAAASSTTTESVGVLMSNAVP
jgi:phage FluMu protein Com